MPDALGDWGLAARCCSPTGVSGSRLATLLAGCDGRRGLAGRRHLGRISGLLHRRGGADRPHYRGLGCDSLPSPLGGGSVIDTAKAVNILATPGGERLLDYVLYVYVWCGCPSPQRGGPRHGGDPTGDLVAVIAG